MVYVIRLATEAHYLPPKNGSGFNIEGDGLVLHRGEGMGLAIDQSCADSVTTSTTNIIVNSSKSRQSRLFGVRVNCRLKLSTFRDRRQLWISKPSS